MSTKTNTHKTLILMQLTTVLDSDADTFMIAFNRFKSFIETCIDRKLDLDETINLTETVIELMESKSKDSRIKYIDKICELGFLTVITN